MLHRSATGVATAQKLDELWIIPRPPEKIARKCGLERAG